MPLAKPTQSCRDPGDVLRLTKSVTNSPEEPIAWVKPQRGEVYALPWKSPRRPSASSLMCWGGGGKEAPTYRDKFGTKLKVRWVFLSLKLHRRS